MKTSKIENKIYEAEKIMLCKNCQHEIFEQHHYYEDYCEDCGELEYQEMKKEQRWEENNNR